MSSARIQGKRWSRLAIDRLDDRIMLATDLAITNVFVRDSDGNPTNLVVGKEVAIQAEYTTEDLPSNAKHHLEVTIGGKTVNGDSTDCAAGFESGSCSWWISGWFVGEGNHQVTARLVAENFVDEVASNNTSVESFEAVRANPPFTLQWPLEHELNEGVYISGYLDVDPTDEFGDFRGSDFSYDGHTGLDMVLPDFAAQDHGVEVRAAASGIVTEVVDGQFDRHTEWLDPVPNANFVVIDHGGGWKTQYWHLRRDSVGVSVGDEVEASDYLGLVGSSGFSRAPHLHFMVQHDGQEVETLMDQAAFWQSAIPQHGTEKRLAVAGVSNYDVSSDILERPSTNNVLTPGERAVGWAIVAGMSVGNEIEFVWRRPNGSVFATDQREFEGAAGRLPIAWGQRLPEDAPTGTWEIDYRVDGQTLGTRTFEVRATGTPEIRVERLGEIVVDGRLTPFDFERVEVSGRPSQSYQIYNHGSADLQISEIEVPVGFSVGRSPTELIPPGGDERIAIQMDTSNAGYFAGNVVIHSNDTDEQEFEFAIEGFVTNSALEPLRLGISDRRVQPNSLLNGVVQLDSARSSDLVVELTASESEVTMPQQVVIPAGETSVRFSIKTGSTSESLSVNLRATAAGFAGATAGLTVDASLGAGWQNPDDANDVNNRDSVSPIDALLIINELNDRRFTDPSDGTILSSAGAPPPFLDVDGNGRVTPLDALLVINALNSSQATSSFALSNLEFNSDSSEQNDRSHSTFGENTLREQVFAELEDDMVLG